jgi:hypothetical protein
MGCGERLAYEVDGRDSHELHVRMDEEPPDELTAPVTTPADDRCFEALRHDRAR